MAPALPSTARPIWAVTGGGEVHVRSLNGDDGRWYSKLMANPDAILHVDLFDRRDPSGPLHRS